MKRIFKRIITLCLVMITFLACSNIVMAASYTASLGSYSVTKGKSTTLYIKCPDIAGGFSIKSSNSNVATVASSTMWCEDTTETMAISTSSIGSTTITITPISVTDMDANDVKLPTKTLTLKVVEPVVIVKSSDATLSSLSVDGATISPEFKKETLEYTVELEPETTKINIKAKTNHNKASINGAGEISVSDGSNKIELVVTAEDGTTKTYVIVANVKELDPIKVQINEIEYSVVRKKADLPKLELFDEATVKIGEENVVAYYNEKLDIYVVGLKDSNGNINFYIYNEKDNSYTLYNQITVGDTTLYLLDSKTPNLNYLEYEVNINNKDITMYKLSKDDKFGLIYGVNVLTGNKGYYVYDIEEESLQRYYDKEIDIYKNIANEYFMALIVSLSIIIFIILLLLIKTIIKSGKKKNKFKNKYKM